jgi:branched-chain amino acid transport system ATP-binding protein
MSTLSPVLDVQGVTAGYGETVVVRDLTFCVPQGQVVVCLGANGVGKTTTLRVAAGLIKPKAGAVLLDGEDVTRRPPHLRARSGLCLIPEGRGIFRALSVAENLRLQQPTWVKGTEHMDAVFEAFPALLSRAKQLAGSLSGGEQQMLALARAWLSSPKVVLLDEVSMGLAPIAVNKVFEALQVLATRGTALLVVEQYVSRALELADLVLVLQKGGVAFFGPPSDLDAKELVNMYMGEGGV